MQSTFAANLKEALGPLPEGSRFEIYNIELASEEEYALFSPKHSSETAHHTHRLILVAARTSFLAGGDRASLICGIEVNEYTVQYENERTERMVYIAKVDTTGSCAAPRGVTSKVVQAYLKSVAPCTVHVFARSQPQYLFRSSARNPYKRQLKERDLVKWWLKVLTRVIKLPPATTTTTGSWSKRAILSLWNWLRAYEPSEAAEAWFSIPSIDNESEAWFEVGGRQLYGEGVWTYGYPYDPDAVAADVLPRFMDDPKTRMLKETTYCGPNTTMKEFWTMLGVTEECGLGRASAFFVVRLKAALTTTTTTRGDVGKCGICDEDQFTDFWNVLMNSCAFDCEDSNVRSTKVILERLRSMNAIPVVVTSSGPVVDSNASPAAPSQAAAVNILSPTLIKRKSTTSSDTSSQPAVNTLSLTLIKRKSTISSSDAGHAKSSSSHVSSQPVVNTLSPTLIKRKSTISSSAAGHAKSSSSDVSSQPIVNTLSPTLIKRKSTTSSSAAGHATSSNSDVSSQPVVNTLSPTPRKRKSARLSSAEGSATLKRRILTRSSSANGASTSPSYMSAREVSTSTRYMLRSRKRSTEVTSSETPSTKRTRRK